MDKDLLSALQNIGDWLEVLAKSLEGKAKTPTAAAVQSGNFSNDLLEISKGIASLKEDNKKILDNQETIIKLQKQEKSKDTKIFDETGKKKVSITDGVSVILLIAGAVLAIGLAFKLVGNIDIMSVISLSTGILIMSLAFKSIADLDIGYARALSTSAVLVIIAGALTVSSFILAKIQPINLEQGLTAVFISLTFALLSKNLKELFIGVAVYDKMGVSKTDLFLAMTGISAAITASSMIMQYIAPIGFAQGLTAIGISLVFSIISYNLHKIAFGVIAFKKTGVKATDLLTTFLGMSAAITASSFILSQVQPLTFSQLITSVFIAGAFALISYNMEKIAFGVVAFKKTGVSAVDLGLVLVGIAGAITASSWLLSMVTPISLAQGLTIALIGLTFGLLSYVMPEMAVGLAIMNKYVKEDQYHLIPLLYVAVSTAIAASSWILAMATPIPFGTMLSIAAMSVLLSASVLAIGATMIILNKIGKTSDYIKGGISILILSSTITIASQILALGEYKKYPSSDWSIGVTLILAAFGIGAILLGTQAMNPFFYAGLGTILLIGGAIVAIDFIMGMGEYKKYPSSEWVVPTMLLIGGFGVMSAGLGLLTPLIAAGVASTLLISGTILAIDTIFRLGEYKKYPSSEWVIPTMLLLGGFAAVATSLAIISPFILLGSAASLIIAGTILALDKIISLGDYKKYPSNMWVSNISDSIVTFAALANNSSIIDVITGSIKNLFGFGVEGIAKNIVKVDNIFSKGNYKKFPSLTWMEGVKKSISIFSTIGKDVSFSDLIIGKLKGLFGFGIESIAMNILKIDTIFNKGEYKKYPNKTWISDITNTFKTFTDMGSNVNIIDVLSGKLKNIFGVGIEGIANSIITLDKIFSAGSFNKYPTIKWLNGITDSISVYANLTKVRIGNITNFDNIFKTILSIDKTLSSGNFNKFPAKAWIDGAIYTITNFGKLSSAITNAKTFGINQLDFTKTLPKLGALSDAFYTLADAFQKFSNSVSSLDSDKLDVIKTLSTNVVLLSLMDPKQFEMVMDSLEKKSSVFGNLINDFDKQKASKTNISSVNNNSKGADRNNEVDLGRKLDTMTALLADISTVVGSSGTLKNYLLNMKEKQIK